MSNLMVRSAFLGTVLTLGACADNPTHPDPQRHGPLVDENSVQCTYGTVCLEPIIVIGDPSGGGGGWSGGGGDDGGDSDPGGHDCITSSGGEPILQGCTGGGSEPDPGEEEYSDICPQPIMGKVATALVTIAGRNHEFKFEGTFWRVNPLVGRSPAWYKMDRPTLSKDSWWMAESGNLLLVCWGRYVTVMGTRVWGGTMYVQDTELHVVMGPGHPDF
ncbi:MAG TPA: hypothetical protein VHG93_17500 [Longimicrobium sp.]|nr:hypothetical protein [Longimicrobium sp.]